MSESFTTGRPLVKEDSAARLLHVEVSTLRRWRWSGDGPRFIKVGAAVRYAPDDLEAFIIAGRRRSTSDAGPAPNLEAGSKA